MPKFSNSPRQSFSFPIKRSRISQETRRGQRDRNHESCYPCFSRDVSSETPHSRLPRSKLIRLTHETALNLTPTSIITSHIAAPFISIAPPKILHRTMLSKVNIVRIARIRTQIADRDEGIAAVRCKCSRRRSLAPSVGRSCRGLSAICSARVRCGSVCFGLLAGGVGRGVLAC